MPQILVHDLRKTYRIHERDPGVMGALRALVRPRHRTVQALQGVSFALEPGELLGFIGPNGAGKSTLLRIAMGLLRPTSGIVRALDQVRTREKDFLAVRRAVGYLFQDPDDQLFCPTVLEDVAFGPLNLGRSRSEAKAQSSRVLAELGLAGYEGRVTHRLSGGEKRLVSLAAVLAMSPQALLLDEPNTGIDEEHAARLESILLDSDLSWAIVSHDRPFLRRVCAKLFVLKDGKLREER